MDRFNSLETKNDQDAYLSGLITVQGVCQKRPRVVTVLPIVNSGGSENEDSVDLVMGKNPNNASFFYRVRSNNVDYPVCGIIFHISQNL